MTTKLLVSTSALAGAPIRIRRKNNNQWLYFGGVKIGRVLPGGILEVKKPGKDGPCERVVMQEAGQQLVAISRRLR